MEFKTVKVTEIENRVVTITNGEERRGSERFCSKATQVQMERIHFRELLYRTVTVDKKMYCVLPSCEA